MAERWRCSPSTQGAGPVERNWRGSTESLCRGEHDALARWCREAQWHAGHTRGGGGLAGEESEGERGLTVHHQALGGVSCNDEVRGGARRGRNQRKDRALRRNGRSGARSSNDDGGALRTQSGGERAREGERGGTTGSRGGGGLGRAHLVAVQGASTPAHARHAAAELCRLATASRRGRPRVDAGAGAWRGRHAGGLGRLGIHNTHWLLFIFQIYL